MFRSAIPLLRSLVVLLAVSTVAWGQIENPAGEVVPEVVLGAFDSRAVALAYYRSDVFMEEMDALKLEHEEALMAGDSARAAELEVMGEASQELAHDRVFSTGDVDEIIWLIYNDLPDVAEEAGVDVIVSIWDLFYMNDEIVYVDVTDELVAFFHPSEETLGIIEEMKGMPAVPMEMMPEDH